MVAVVGGEGCARVAAMCCCICRSLQVYLEASDRVHGAVPSREEFGFGAKDVILSCFNQLYKIEPKVETP